MQKIIIALSEKEELASSEIVDLLKAHPVSIRKRLVDLFRLRIIETKETFKNRPKRGRFTEQYGRPTVKKYFLAETGIKVLISKTA